LFRIVVVLQNNNHRARPLVDQLRVLSPSGLAMDVAHGPTVPAFEPAVEHLRPVRRCGRGDSAVRKVEFSGPPLHIRSAGGHRSVPLPAGSAVAARTCLRMAGEAPAGTWPGRSKVMSRAPLE